MPTENIIDISKLCQTKMLMPVKRHKHKNNTINKYFITNVL